MMANPIIGEDDIRLDGPAGPAPERDPPAPEAVVIDGCPVDITPVETGFRGSSPEVPELDVFANSAAAVRSAVPEALKIIRARRLTVLANQVFGDATKALTWLTQPQDQLGGKSVMRMAETEAGARQVEEALRRVDEERIFKPSEL